MFVRGQVSKEKSLATFAQTICKRGLTANSSAPPCRLRPRRTTFKASKKWKCKPQRARMAHP